MNVIVNETDTAVIIKLEGEMMLGYEATDFQEAVQSSIEKKSKCVIVDLSGVKFISSWGIGILIYGYTTTINNGGSFRLVSVPDSIIETFKKIKIDNIFQRFDTVEEALNS